jgi:tetratricopeptide (TPR) repeat protein
LIKLFLQDSLEDKQGAIDDLNQAIRVNSNNVLAYAERGISRVFEDRKAAEADLKKALSLNIDTKDAVTYRRRGQLRFGLDDFKGAIADFDQALRINPNFAKAYTNRGMARTKLDDVHGAIADCFQALHINPKDALANLCIIQAPQGEWNRKDIVAYDQALQRYPNSAIVYYHRGGFREELGDKKDAIVMVVLIVLAGVFVLNWETKKVHSLTLTKSFASIRQILLITLFVEDFVQNQGIRRVRSLTLSKSCASSRKTLLLTWRVGRFVLI